MSQTSGSQSVPTTGQIFLDAIMTFSAIGCKLKICNFEVVYRGLTFFKKIQEDNCELSSVSTFKKGKNSKTLSKLILQRIIKKDDS